jgi:hypothetical protein
MRLSLLAGVGRRAVVFTGLTSLVGIGCGHSRLVPAPTAAHVPGAPGAAILAVGGVGCAADAQAWRLGAGDLPDSVMPFKVRVANSSGLPIRIRYQDFALVGAKGHQYLPIPVLPLDPDGQSTRLDPLEGTTRFFIAPRFHDIYQTVDAWPQPLARDDDLYETQYRRWGRTPSADIVESGMPEGVLGDGGVITGFLFFERPSGEDAVTFQAEFDDSDGKSTVALVKIPFRVQ